MNPSNCLLSIQTQQQRYNAKALAHCGFYISLLIEKYDLIFVTASTIKFIVSIFVLVVSLWSEGYAISPTTCLLFAFKTTCRLQMQNVYQLLEHDQFFLTFIRKRFEIMFISQFQMSKKFNPPITVIVPGQKIMNVLKVNIQNQSNQPKT